jgi:hypothetical protein
MYNTNRGVGNMKKTNKIGHILLLTTLLIVYHKCANTSLLSDEQYNELIKIRFTRIGQEYLKCVCKSKYQNKKCICFKNNILCTSKCHFSTTCYNK